MLGCETRRYPSRIKTIFDYQRDLFLIYPPPSSVYNRPTRDAQGRFSQPFPYPILYSFFSSTKADQRRTLQSFSIPVPETYVSRYEAAYATAGSWVVRPMHHSGGHNYRVTNEATDFREGAEYISRLFPKEREYRLIFVKGTPLLLLKKKVPQGLSNEAPWNHTNGSSFVTIQDIPQSKLKVGTDAFERLSSVPIINHAHIAAIDILWSQALGYVVCEVNSCPGLSIAANLERVAHAASTPESR